jgi:hypothetical protein
MPSLSFVAFEAYLYELSLNACTSKFLPLPLFALFVDLLQEIQPL